MLLELADAAGISKCVKFDSSLARGLDYYTGAVFEVMAKGVSCGAGGRYDRLVNLYGGAATPAVGISFGIDRILDLIGDAGKGAGKPVRNSVFLFAIGKGMEKSLVRVAGKMRAAGIPTEMGLLGRSASRNMEYANKKGFALAAIMGEEELKKGTLTVKDLKTGKEQAVALSGLDEIRGMLAL